MSPPRHPPIDLLDSEQAAAAIGVSVRTLRKLRKDGLISYVATTDRLVMYRPEDCAEFIASRLRRNEPCQKPAKPRRTRPPAQGGGGQVIPFEQLAQARGW
ncbi:MAG TPA: helix-turn-helix domain-containing protein [Allosphingosinicella sp.]